MPDNAAAGAAPDTDTGTAPDAKPETTAGTAGDEPGTYRQTACILGGNDMAKSISRSITITAD